MLMGHWVSQTIYLVTKNLIKYPIVYLFSRQHYTVKNNSTVYVIKTLLLN